jgi:hypothetical protein
VIHTAGNSPERIEPVDRLDALTVGDLDVDRGRLQVGVPREGAGGFARCAGRRAAASSRPAPGGTDLFSYNQFQLRSEIPVGIGVLRPQAFCVTYITPGS